MKTVAVWYLIVNWYHGGAVVIPEPSREECLRIAAYLYATTGPAAGSPYTYCVSGIK